MSQDQTKETDRPGLSARFQEMKKVPIVVRGVLVRLRMSAGRIMELAPGQLVPLGIEAGSSIQLRAPGVFLAVADVRVHKGECWAEVLVLQPGTEESHGIS